MCSSILHHIISPYLPLKTSFQQNINKIYKKNPSKMRVIYFQNCLPTFIVLFVLCSQVKSQFMVPPAPQITDLKGGPCVDNQTCQALDSHAYCKPSPSVATHDRDCHCEPGYVSSSDRARCLEAEIRLGGSCQENQQCLFWETSTAVCLPGSEICDCIPGYIPSDDLTRCLPMVNVLGTVTCQEDAQCQLGKPGKLSKCDKRSNSSSDDFRVCKCQGNAVNAAKDHKCYPVAEYPGDECAIHAQCTVGLKHSRCVNSRCKCNQGYNSKEANGKRSCS